MRYVKNKAKKNELASAIKNLLAKRVGYKCSKPDCRRSTTGPNLNLRKSINIIVTAHITAASKDGPRYNEKLTVEERKSVENGIWIA